MFLQSHFMKYPRVNNPYRPVKERVKDFAELQHVLSDEERRKQAARCMNCGVPHCHVGFFYSGGKAVSGCPNDNLIPEWNDMVSQAKDRAAFERLTKTNYLPDFTGRVCPAPCEVACNEALHGKGITIKDNERFIIDQGFKYGWVKESGLPVKRNGIKIAIVGSGPTGILLHSLIDFQPTIATGGSAATNWGFLLLIFLPLFVISLLWLWFSDRLLLKKKGEIPFS